MAVFFGKLCGIFSLEIWNWTKFDRESHCFECTKRKKKCQSFETWFLVNREREQDNVMK